MFGRVHLEKAMAPHSSTLAWKIPWMEEPGRLQSMGSRRVGHDWATSLSLSCIGEGNGNLRTQEHSSVLAWRIPGTGEPGGLPSMGLHRVGHDWSDLAAAAAAEFTTWAWCFLFLKVISCWFNFFNRHRPLQSVYCFFLAVLHGLWDLSSLTRDWTRALGSEKR